MPTASIPAPHLVPARRGRDRLQRHHAARGVAYDLFGNGKTSVKVNLGKYLESANNQDRYTLDQPGAGDALHRAVTGAELDRRRRRLRAAVRSVEPTPPTASAARGTTTPSASRPPPDAINPDILHGWGVRPSDWQFGASVQHEILPRVSAEIGYNRRWFRLHGDRQPLDLAPRLRPVLVHRADTRPAGRWRPPATYRRVPRRTPSAAPTNYVTFANDYGDTEQYWHGVDINVNARLRNGLVVPGRHQHRPRRPRQLRGRGQASGAVRSCSAPRAGRVVPRDRAVAHAVPRARVLHDPEDRRADQRQLPVQAGNAGRRRQ